MEYLSEEIMAAIRKQEELGGINVHKLKLGTKLLVKTKNSLYSFESTIVPGEMIAQGGKYLLKPKKIYFSGSTFGGSMLKIGWIGYGMHMEMLLEPRRVLKTTPVLAARIIGNGWEYDMGWT
jgi:hypothetical protein